MTSRSFPCLPALACVLAFALWSPVHADEKGAPLTAQEVAAKLGAGRSEASSLIRVRMEIAGPTKETLQLQIKERRSGGKVDLVYEVLWPKERKGEAVLLRKAGGRVSGTHFIPPATVQPISDLKEALFGSDLSYEDVIEDFFAWEHQSLVGAETVNGIECQILESKPGKARSSYTSVKTWVDARRMVPARVEKYGSGGQLARRVVTTKVVTDDGRSIPANLDVTTPRTGSTTSMDGSRIKHDVSFTERDFSVDGLKGSAEAKP